MSDVGKPLVSRVFVRVIDDDVALPLEQRLRVGTFAAPAKPTHDHNFVLFRITHSRLASNASIAQREVKPKTAKVRPIFLSAAKSRARARIPQRSERISPRLCWACSLAEDQARVIGPIRTGKSSLSLG